MSRSLLLQPCTAAGALLLAGCSTWPSVWVEDEHRFELPAAGVEKASVTTHNGDVVVRPGDDATVLVVARVRAGGSSEQDAAACLAAVDIQVHVLGSEVVAAWEWTGSPRSGWEAEVSFDVTVPAHSALALESHNGGLRVENVTGAVDASTHNGDVHVSGCPGDWNLETHNGDITASGEPGTVNARSHNGELHLALDTAGAVHGRAETHNGDIELSVGPAVDTRLRCSTRNGGLHCGGASFHDVQVEDDSFTGTLGSGTGSLELATHNGSVEVRQPGAASDA